jgi:hypothetical protein
MAISSQIATTPTTAIQPSALPTPTPQASALATTILSISSQPTVASGSPPPDDESIDVEENRFFFLKDQLDQQAAIHEVLLEMVNELTKALQRPTDQSTMLPPPNAPYYQPTFGHPHPYANTIDKSRQLDRVLRNLPTFSGKADENFDAYIIGVRKTLEGFAQGCTEAEKLTAVRVKITGDACELLESNDNLLTVNDLLSSLQVTFGRDQRTTIADVKQRVDESVRKFAHRLRMSLRILGWVGADDPDKPNLVSLEFFINGLLSGLSQEVRKLCPRTMGIAIDYAIQLESQRACLPADASPLPVPALTATTSFDRYHVINKYSTKLS